MDTPKVSVIVPVYNVENYIEQCIESIVNQSLRDIEIIIVNDGTKDNSMKKIEKYLVDPRVVVINKENEGLSSARNTGLKVARGEYLAFVDSDDFIEKTMLEELYSCTIKEKYDIVASSFYFYDNISKNKRKKEEKEEKEGRGISFYELCGVEVWDKIYRKEFLLKNNLFFKEGIIHEDDLFSIKSFLYANKMKYINKYHYNYRINRSNSIMNSIKSSLMEKRKYSLEKIIEELSEIEKDCEENTFEKIYFKLIILEREILYASINCETLDKSKIKNLEKRIKRDWKKFNNIEKRVFKIQLQKILKTKQFYNFSLFDSFYWRNKMITKKIFRRAITTKIKFLLKNKGNKI